jgi:hypothetical protein
LQDIQRKRDATNRNWQRIILYNIAKSLHNDSAGVKDVETAPECESGRAFPQGLNRKFVFGTRQLWWKLHEKMQIPEYANMLLLVKMKDELETRLYRWKQRQITFSAYEELVNKLHLDTEGHAVEPFVKIADRQDREERQRKYHETITQDLEEECLIT